MTTAWVEGGEPVNWVRRIFGRKRIYGELSEEIREHLDEKVEELVASGMTREEAEHAARREFGNVMLAEERGRDVWRWATVEDFLIDVRYALRILRKSPGFTAVAIITLALGIGANTAIFSAVNGILLEPLPYADSGRLVQINARVFSHGFMFARLSLPQIRAIRARCPAFGQTAFYGGYGGVDLIGGTVPVRVLNGFVSGNFFTMLGIRPLLGRPILPSDAKLGNDKVALLSYTLWKSDFSGDPGVVGRTITLAKKPFTIIGVTPQGTGRAILGRKRSLWRPLVPSVDFSTARKAHHYRAIARLRAGATLAEANAQLATLSARLAAAYPKTDKGWKLSATGLKTATVGPTVATELWILLAAVGLVLLIACVNVGSMLLASSWVRRREVAIRRALGATRWQIVRQLLAESLLLSLAGGVLGLLLAAWAVPVLRAIAPPDTPRIGQLRLDANILWFTLGVSVLTGLLFGLAPALLASGNRVGATLKEGFGGVLGGLPTRGPLRLHSLLVVIEVALAVILVAGATLVGRSLENMMDVRLGFRTEHVLTFGVSLVGSACNSKHPEPCYAAAQDILRRLRGLPRVEAVTAGGSAPLGGGYGVFGVDVEGRAKPATSDAPVMFDWTMPGYFRVMGIPLLGGRDFTEADTGHSTRVVIVNQAFARRFFQGMNPLGQRISMSKDNNGQPQWMEVVGEVANTRQYGAVFPPPALFYMPGMQANGLAGYPTFLVRTATNPLALASAVKQQIMSVDKDAPILDLEAMNRAVAEKEAGPRFRTLLLGAFGVLGLLLAMVGIYGVISYGVNRRVREIGLRMALGALPGDTLRMLVREGMVLAAAGIAIGICGALAATRLLRSYLFEVKPNDPGTFVAVAIGITLAALVACHVPARRAMRVDPVEALREE